MTDDEGFGETVAASEPQVAATASAPKLIGRFVVDGPLGRGGMGLVVAAHDPDLDRKVAIKLLHDDGGGSVGRTRLMREAQAMARLRHPNVVTVHEAGTHEGRFYVAMELVPGGTLRSWMEAHPRASAPEVLEMFEPAGRGLVAAHAAGLVHRDFKPENVLIDADGRVLVTDFGLAGLHGARPAYEGERTDPGPAPSAMDATVMPEESARPVGDSSSPLHQSLTRTGDVMGTPRYMSPEQHRGDPSTDARTDQFAFCAALYEALYGVRAFAGETYDAIRRNAEAGKLTPPGALREVPAAIHDAVLRGLEVEPDDRWPSMEALLDALAPAPVIAPAPPPVIVPPSRAPWIVVAVVAAAAIALAVVLLWPRAKADPLAKQHAAEAAAKACDCELLTVELPEGATLADEPLATGQLAVPRGAQRIRYEAGGETYAYAIVSLGAGASRTIALPAPARRDGFVFVPGGDVTVGDVEGGGAADELPTTVVHLAPYLIARAEAPAPATFAAARAQAWAAHARLPTAAEWEWAARLGFAGGMLGAEWEWTATRYAPYPYVADGRDDALAEGETIEVRGGQDGDASLRVARRREGRRTGEAQVRFAVTVDAIAPQEVSVRIVTEKTRPGPGEIIERDVVDPADRAAFHAFIEAWAQQAPPPALQIQAAPEVKWCKVLRELEDAGLSGDRVEIVPAPAGEPRVTVRWHPQPAFRAAEPLECRLVTTTTEVETLPPMCFDGTELRPESLAAIPEYALAIRVHKLTEIVLDVAVAADTPDPMATSELRGQALRKALFAAGVKAVVLILAQSNHPEAPTVPYQGGLFVDADHAPCVPGDAGRTDRVLFHIMARGN